MCGGNAGNTDRKETLNSYGDLDSVFKGLSSLSAKSQNTGATQTQAGGADTGDASKYYSSLLSGNTAATTSAAAPEINAITGQANQQKKELANFGNRSGGKVAAAQDITAGSRGAIADTIAKQRSGAAGAKAGIGAGETSAGATSTGQAISAEGAAGDVASNLGNLSVRSRQLSQQIHDQAVKQWADVISSALMS